MTLNKENANIVPYFNTLFTTCIGLHPNQMTKQIQLNLKNNLIKKFQNKCFKSYGYICKIYSIKDYTGGLIIPENSIVPAMYKISFYCKLCRPLRGTTIVFEVKSINTTLIHLMNGPIECVIFDGYDKINYDNFTFDEKQNVLLGKIDQNKGIKILPGTYVNVKILDTRIEHNTSRILVIGIMDKLSSKDEIKNSNIEKELEEGLKSFEYEEYVKFEEPDENDELINETHEQENNDEI